MLVLGIETSCDETGVALYSTREGLRAQALHSQAAMHENYGGVVPELASRDHVQRLVPLIESVLAEAGCTLSEVDAIGYTRGPGLAGALLVGAAVATALGYALQKPVVGVHHLEGHLLSPLLSSEPPEFPFVALLVSGGHTQLLRVEGLGRYELLGDTVDDAAGEAFDKSAKLLGLGYPGGPALSALAAAAPADAGATPPFPLPRLTWVSTAVFRPLKLKSRSSERSLGRGKGNAGASAPVAAVATVAASADSAGPPG